MSSSRPLSLTLRLSPLLLPLLLAACSSGDGETSDPSTGGSAGQSGASTGGAAGKASAGAAGTTSAGAGGSTGGAAGKVSAGAGGSAGGSGQAGAAGKVLCDAASDCAGLLPTTKPANCATATCDTSGHFCRFVAKDLDGDGDPSNTCASQTAGITIELGGDCDDSDKNVNAKAWDGPKGTYQGEDQPDHCDDGKDNNCNGTIDDGKLDDGTTCKCTPGDIRKCSQDSAGKPITFPGGKPDGLCTYGNQTCSDKGKWGECTGAVGPAAEECNGKDDDCDGQTDETADVLNPPTWTCDMDGDNHASAGAITVKQCGQPSQACGTAGVWTTNLLPVDDCNDLDPTTYLGAPELCDNKDNNCNGQFDEGSQAEYCLDADNDNYCDQAAPTIFACMPSNGYRPKANIAGYERTGCDTSKDINPGKPEVCDGIDNNCDPSGLIDEGKPGSGAACDTGKLGVCSDGLSACEGGKIVCNQITKSSKELCESNGKDEDCDGNPKNGCECTNGDKGPCTPPIEGCGTGSHSCSGGKWSACTGGYGVSCALNWIDDQSAGCHRDYTKTSSSLNDGEWGTQTYISSAGLYDNSYGATFYTTLKTTRLDGGCKGKDEKDGGPVLIRAHCEGPGGSTVVDLHGDDFWKGKTTLVPSMMNCNFEKVTGWTPAFQNECKLQIQTHVYSYDIPKRCSW